MLRLQWVWIREVSEVQLISCVKVAQLRVLICIVQDKLYPPLGGTWVVCTKNK